MFVFETMGVAGGFETIADTSTAIGFTAAKIAPTTGNHVGKKAKAALISVETADVRFTLDGTTPTITAGTGAGHLLPSGGEYEIKGTANVANFKVINAVDASGAVVKCTYFF